ncbi:MAG: hypothetical protein MUP15_02620 [Dehalococcoidia bacterium]|nr:hypothetical protein [Dehalococcoidia bacterium]
MNEPKSQDELKAWVKQRAKVRHAAACAYQREVLKGVDDDTLRELHKTSLAAAFRFDKSQDDMVLEEAIALEVDRRMFSAGWIWNRWRRPEDFTKWQAHHAEAQRIIQGMLALVAKRAA